jgi:hypothetical protein
MYKRLELHNHTTESDAQITVEELIQLMEKDQVDAFALTDHNTISGNEKAKRFLESNQLKIQCIYGMEYSTYYGHILCFNLEEYVSWENINRRKPELLFQAVRKKGALVGIAHPFSVGAPFQRGCRFEMEISDYGCVDFIEIFNNSRPLSGNHESLLYWEGLVLQGLPIAKTAGMDLHRNISMNNKFTTYIKGQCGGNISKELEKAIRHQETWVSKGPILEVKLEDSNKNLKFNVIETEKAQYLNLDSKNYLITLTTTEGILNAEISEDFPVAELGEAKIVIPKLYYKEEKVENLICVAPVIVI